MSVSYEYYKIFYYVGKYHSFSSAAEKLTSSQPNITRAMNNLESALDCRLFVRSNKGVKLTSEGEVLFRYVEAAYREIKTAEAELGFMKNLQKGHVSVGFSTGLINPIFRNRIFPVLHRYHELYPQIRVQIINDSTPRLLKGIAEGNVDLALVTSCDSGRKDLKATMLESYSDVLVAGNSFKELSGRELTLAGLAEYPLVSLCRDTETYSFYHSFFADHGAAFEPDIELATLEQVMLFVQNGMGLGFVDEPFAKEALKKKQLIRVKLKEKIPRRQVNLVQEGDRPVNAAAAALKKLLVEEADP